LKITHKYQYIKKDNQEPRAKGQEPTTKKTMTTTFTLLTILLSYVLGSIPFGYIVTKHFLKINILEKGSGNIGSTNVKRVAGRKISIYSQLLDMAKGGIIVAIVLIFQKYNNTFTIPDYLIYAVAIASIAGHNFSIFLKFRGGKGVNTTLGASILIAPIPVLISVVFYFTIKWITKYVSMGSLAIAFTLPIISYIQSGINNTFYYFLICSLMIIIQHLPNIKRLINGTELRVE
jgi:acyl phosphate:glycerol-3-phosphate acyltransferase